MTTPFDHKFDLQFKGGECQAVACGGKNPIASAMAAAMLQEMNSFSVAITKTAEMQSIGNAFKSGGIQLG